MKMYSCMREKKIVCADRYMEVDIYSISPQQYKRGRRRKRIPSRSAQQELNRKNSAKHLACLATTNFTENDIHVTLTYNDKRLPKTRAEAEHNFRLFLRRINRYLKTAGYPPAKYIAIAEGGAQTADEPQIRYHHHLILSCDLSREQIALLWSKLGTVQIDDLHFENENLEKLCSYLLKRTNGKRRWKQSRNLKQPEMPRPNDDRYSRREIEKIISSGTLYDAGFWNKQYPGWYLISVTPVFSDFTGWSIYVKMKVVPEKNWGNGT